MITSFFIIRTTFNTRL